MDNQIQKLAKNIRSCKLILILTTIISTLPVFSENDIAIYLVLAFLIGQNLILSIIRISHLSEKYKNSCESSSNIIYYQPLTEAQRHSFFILFFTLN